MRPIYFEVFLFSPCERQFIPLKNETSLIIVTQKIKSWRPFKERRVILGLHSAQILQSASEIIIAIFSYIILWNIYTIYRYSYRKWSQLSHGPIRNALSIIVLQRWQVLYNYFMKIWFTANFYSP